MGLNCCSLEQKERAFSHARVPSIRHEPLRDFVGLNRDSLKQKECAFSNAHTRVINQTQAVVQFCGIQL